MPDADLEARLVAVGGDVERTSRRVDRVENLLRVISENLAELTRAIETVEPERPVVRSWLLAEDADQAREDLADLVDWLGRVYLRYPDGALVSCWLWHPAVVEELWWLRCAHQEAYDGPHASYTRVADWHDRQRPGVVSRIRRWLRDCDLIRHQQASAAPEVPLIGCADRIAETWSTKRTTPTPTTEEITEADQYEHNQHRTKDR